MQAIQTKFISPTNYKGARIKASCERGSIVLPWDQEMDVDGNHKAAARALCAEFAAEDQAKYGGQLGLWAKPFVTGTPKEGSYVHVFTA